MRSSSDHTNFATSSMLQTKDYIRFRADAAKALEFVRKNSRLLEQQFLSTGPQEVLLPNGLAFGKQLKANKQQRQQQSCASSQLTNANILDHTRAITRPQYLDGIRNRLNDMLKQQQTVSFESIDVMRCKEGIVPHRSIVLRGCKGIGKSYLLHMTATHLIARDKNVRVVYISNCGNWRRCTGSIERSIFLAEAFSAAFSESAEIQHMVDMWIEQLHHCIYGESPLFLSLLGDIEAYCQHHDLNIVMLLDCIDEIAGSDIENREIVSDLVYMQRRYCYPMVLAASDDSKARELSERFNAGDLTINRPFSSTEASLYISTCGLGKRLHALQLKQLLKCTWQHPSELHRLCQLIRMEWSSSGNNDLEVAVSMGIDKFILSPFVNFVPQPFASYLFQAQVFASAIAKAVMDTLCMNNYSGGFIDTNYMVPLPASKDPVFMYPSPQIAKGIVELHCKTFDDISHSIDRYLTHMHSALYQRLL
ncbi:hypothetical protein IWW48_001670 [Coemansia sp. RSA 1200]|nr:hypothetical protein IWW48_001670 [Coemansia sp. RSA 1200]